MQIWSGVHFEKKIEIQNNMQILKVWYTWVHVDCKMFRAVRLVEPERRFKRGCIL
jgi:hypothetical protein